MTEDERAGLEFLKLYEGIAFAVRDIEKAVGIDYRTLAPALGRFADQRKEGLERATVKRPESSYDYNKSVDEYQGFRYVGERCVGDRGQFVVRGTAWLEESETP